MAVTVLMGDRLLAWEEESLEALRAAAMAEFDRAQPVGEEIAGVLYGRVAGGVTRIVAWRAITGVESGRPAVPLSDAAFAHARLLVTEFRNDLALRDLKPLGWFRSRTRGMAALSPEDSHVCGVLFDNRPCLAVILRPSTQKPVTAAFFEVEPGSSIENSRRGVSISLESPSAASPLAEAEAEPEAPAFAEAQPSVERRRRGWIPLVVASSGLVALAAAAVFLGIDRPIRFEGETTPAGAILRWNPYAGILTGATGAELTINGESIELDRGQLRSGSRVIDTGSPLLRVSIRLRGPNAANQQAALLFVRDSK